MPYNLIKASPRTRTEEPPDLNLKRIGYILEYRKWMIVFLFIVISSAVIAIGRYMPKVYRAGTTILFEPKDISRDFIRSVIDMPMEKRLLNLSKKVKNRGRIKQIISEFQLDRNVANPKELEELITQLQEKITVEESKNEAFTISYKGPEPQQVMQVANRITDLFMGEQQQDSQRRAKAAALLLSRESEKLEQQLKEQSAKIKEFRGKHMGELPEEETALTRTLDRLQMKVQDDGYALRNMQEEKLFLERQLLSLASVQGETGDDYAPPTSYRRLNELKSELAKLKRRYSDEWLEVKKIKREIAALEEELEIDSASKQEKKPAYKVSPVSQELQERISNMDKSIANVTGERNRTLEEIKAYTRRVERLPQVKQEMDRLTERYTVLEKDYESLRTKKLDAKLSEDFEFAGRSGYFVVLERAELPLEPVKPDMKQFLLIALMAGLGGGVGMAFVAEHMDDSLKDPDEAESYLGLSVIGLIPILKASQIARQARSRRIRYAMFLCLYLVCIWLLIRYQSPAKSFMAARKYPDISDSTSAPAD